MGRIRGRERRGGDQVEGRRRVGNFNTFTVKREGGHACCAPPSESRGAGWPAASRAASTKQGQPTLGGGRAGGHSPQYSTSFAAGAGQASRRRRHQLSDQLRPARPRRDCGRRPSRLTGACAVLAGSRGAGGSRRAR